MSDVKMPEPVGYQWLDTGHFRKKIPKGCDVSAFRELVTVDQAKAYAESRVREALKEAADIANEWAMQYVEVDTSPVRVGSYILDETKSIDID